MTVDFIKRGEELVASSTLDRSTLVNAMLDAYLSGEVDFSVHPDQWVRDLQPIDLSEEQGTNIARVEYFGDADTYDLEVDHPDHQFYLPNGILTSNSHAVAYAIDSYMCAWLLTHHEEEWLTSYLESMSNSPEDKVKAFGEIRQMGYQIVPIDINHATKTWTVISGKKFMPSFLSVKGVGDSAIDEIIANRPYTSIESLLWNDDGSWRHSKFNKRALESLVKVGAFQSLNIVGPDKLFKSYKQMYFVLIENNDMIRKSTKKDPFLGRKNFYELIKGSQDMDEWTHSERAANYVDCLGSADITAIVDPSILAKLQDKDVKSIDDLESGKEIVWFAIQSIEPRKTKTGKSYLSMGVVGPKGKTHKIFCWGWDGVRKFQPYGICIAEVEKNDFGLSTTLWRLKEIDTEAT